MRRIAMTTEKKRKLEKKGWRVGSVSDFLELSPEENAYVELKVRLSKELRQRRQKLGISQVEVAKKLQSSQSRVAKMEAGDPSVSIDLLVRSLLALGGRVTLLRKAV
jgi:ribosome-binding protein aMBF1 (putative translation factor)